MEDLLPHYERELAFLRTRSADFARQYPKIAGRLQLSGDAGDDPHVERLIQSFALLASRVHKRLDDDFPLFTESLLEVLYPHYLRPFPSCAIARMDLGAQAGQMTQPATLERGTLLHSRPVKGVTCRFRTTREVTLLPLKVQSVQFRHAIGAPEGSALPSGVTSVLSIVFEKLSPQMSWRQVLSRPLSIHLDGEASHVSALREAFCDRAIGVAVQRGAHQPWRTLADTITGERLRPLLEGFDDAEALLDWDDRGHRAYRLLTEYFAFPEKFNFVRLPATGPQLPDEAVAQADGTPLTLHILLGGIRADADLSRLLEATTADQVVLGATPVVNLFRQAADPIRITHQSTGYPVVVDARKAFGYELYSLDRVHRVRQTGSGQAVDEVRPFFSIRHDDVFDDQDEDGRGDARGRTLAYWQLHRDEDVARTSPGYECEISLVDPDMALARPAVDTLSLEVTATNRDLPSLLSPGAPGGDLFMEGGGAVKEIRLLRKPTATHRFTRNKGALWRLISHLSLNHLSLSGGGVDALKEMLRLYDLPRSPVNRRQIDGIEAVSFQPATAWLPGEPFATFVRGVEVTLTVDEASFVGSGLGLFVAVLERFLALYVSVNSFSRLTVRSARSSEVLYACSPRNGDIALL